MAITSAAVARTALRTKDPAEAVERIRSITPHRAAVAIDDYAAVHFHIDSASYGGFFSDTVTAGGVRYLAEGEPLGFVRAGVLVSGEATLRSGRETVGLRSQDAFMHPGYAAYSAEYLNPTVLSLRVPMSLLARLAEEKAGSAGADLRFVALTPVSQSMRQRYAEVVLWVCRQLRSYEDEPSSLLLDQLMRLSAAAMLSTFPNTLMTADDSRDAGALTPAIVKRARAFIEAYADRPLDVADIAAASGVGTRAIQVAFRRHLGTTPMALLRRVRLEHVYRQLREADSTQGVTVSATARQWGFAEMGRFAGEYRKVFGELPSQTLRS
ncbi:helix-turn-helix transcriptional regulator [Actinoplanes sp. Pm04-4]|uniref:Helix-turn-helix transcriptional regulator n=1 Tax=Paractinoplanes pyxinae TaxID=2997416 RepID=A0ABT4BGZ4_9ACTN|nr:helix-turn-helix transcriptional regulator [Actinoplanes pyxinae]MCY1145757.1 helix-turn-helix transcriptional regulator [Actinoplanes pyxinae]